ncbi:putative beta-D-xylosidase 2 [Phytophthora citrophthora]|uniref:Beta-D-xylosidase 2 n=1 Tax=Phytophthora citrophthora TaxID=4793 RepID=A0AAD9GUN4_9STRA|nr:putative beta-D-xylosidase 2 [Phytophthora citrophthora]
MRCLRFELGLFDPIGDQPYWKVKPSDVNTVEAKQLSLDLARKSIVLLQNNNSVLPLQKGTKLAVLGPHAQAKWGLIGNYLGQMCHGDYNEVGCIQTPLEAVTATNGAASTSFALGCNISGNSTAGFDEAVKVTQEADAAVLFLGIDETIEAEVNDRNHINLPAIQMQLLQRIRATEALMEAFYPGFFGAQAMADVLFGDTNPGGKLPVTMYRSDYVTSIDMKSMNMTAAPGRSYRYFEGEPVFPFGWGLSYTTFSLASSVVFAYFRPVTTGATGPATLLNQQLFDYRRVGLKPTEKNQVSFTAQRSTLALVDEQGNLVSFPGSYEIIVTNGVHERQTFRVQVDGEPEIIRAHV